MTINTMKKLILLLLLLVSTNVFALTLEEQLNENNKLEDIVKTKAKLLMDDTVYLSCVNISHGNTYSYFFYKGNVIDGEYTMFIKNPSVLQGSPDVITKSPSLVDTYISKDYILFYKIMNDREFEYAHMWVKYTKTLI